MNDDPRFPILLRARLDPAELGPSDLVLLDAALELPAPDGVAVRTVAFRPEDGHPAACPCCVQASPLARVLLRLVVERARGEVPFFARLVAISDVEGRTALRAAVTGDPLVSSRYKL